MVIVSTNNDINLVIDDQMLLESLFANNGDEVVFTRNYENFILTVIGYSEEYPGTIKYYFGFINHKEKDISSILEKKEVEEESYFGWSAIDKENLGYGFKCSHFKDVIVSENFIYEDNLLLRKLVFNKINEEATFKSKEWVFERLTRIADKVITFL